ncbi:MAG: glycosyltransferase family 2 protein, partial [Oscillospiraceae bacterium]|nr:glycosyltransferase family 2 protein [Oscillospiraceae bacterium]
MERCLESVLAQSYANYEVLMIDDGSTDASAQIAAAYAEKDPRFLLIRQQNAGVSEARNRAMELAKGDAVNFIDGDDYVEPDCLEQIAEVFRKEDAQIVFFGANRVSEEKTVVARMHAQHLPESYAEKLIALTRADAFGYTWLKSIRKEIIADSKFCGTLQPFEDEVFTCELMKKRPAIAHVDRILYHQVVVLGSLSRRPYPDYYGKCEAVYLAWKSLLSHVGAEGHPVLMEKANRMTVACKYCILEQDIPVLPFIRGTAGCTFLMESSENDPLVRALRRKKFGKVLMMRCIYRLKNYI